MHRLVSSPRRRRRLKWAGAAGVVVLAVVGIVLLLPQPPAPSVSPAKNAPRVKLVTHSTYVSPRERRQIDSVLDRFVPAALSHDSMRTAWKLAGPELTGGTTLKEWLHGTSPIPYYPVGGTTFHSWKTIDSGPGYVVFNLLVHPRHKLKTGAWVFSGEMVKRGSHWLVNRFYTIALLSPPTKSGRHEIGPADFAASAPSAPPAAIGHGRLGKVWLAAIGGVVLLVILFPLGFGIASVLRSRRARKQYEVERDAELPPLPRSRTPVA